MVNGRSGVWELIRCPVCGEGVYVSDGGKSLFCRGVRRHCFDFSSDGYLNLSRVGGGDSKGAVAARRSFLDAGYYEPLAREVTRILSEHTGKGAHVLDAGCGEGYFTNIVAGASGLILGADLSKFAVAVGARSAARQGIENVSYITGSVFDLPLYDGGFDCVLSIMAPFAESESARVLKSGGAVVLVSAGKDHLMGLKRVLYTETYENGERKDMPRDMFIHAASEACEFDINVRGQSAIQALFEMTPYYWRTSEQDKQKLCELDRLDTCVSFNIDVFYKK